MTVTDEARRASLRGLAGLVVAATLPGCGGGGGGEDNPVVSLQLEPAINALAPGQSTSLRAVARHADGGLDYVTQESLWQSSNTAVATVNSFGDITAVAPGSVTITVTFKRLSVTLALRVGTFLQALDISAVSFRFALGIGGTYQLFATGHYTSSSTDVTDLARWASSSAAVAAITNGTSGGIVRGVSEGAVTITGSLDGIDATMRMPVFSHRRLDHDDSESLATDYAVGVDARGAAVAVWTRRFSSGGRPDLSWSRYQPGAGWSAPAPLRPFTTSSMSSALSVSMNDNGAAVVAWQQLDGLYAARFNGSPGWDAPVLVATHATPFGPSLQTALGIDRNGNAVLLWPGSLEGSSGFYFSWLDVATGSWTAAAQIPGSDLPGALTAWRVATNAAGEAVLVWTLMPALASGDPHRIHAVRWRPPGNGQPGGWTARERIGEPGVAGPQLAVSMDESGAIHVAWCYSLQMADGSFGPDTVRGRRFLHSAGWQAEQTVVAGTTLQPRLLVVAGAAGRGSAAAWANSYDHSIQAALMAADGTWGAPVTITSNDHPSAQIGDPLQLHAVMLADGRLLTSWLASDNAITGILATRVHHPASGWLALRRDPHVGRIGQVSTVALAYTPGGDGVLFWEEANQGGSDLFGHTGLLP